MGSLALPSCACNWQMAVAHVDTRPAAALSAAVLRTACFSVVDRAAAWVGRDQAHMRSC